jgi:hypothetical protein
MQIVVSGASGLVGSALAPLLASAGHQVRRLVRGSTATEADIRWDPLAGSIDRRALAGCDAVVHLAGENIAGRRWSMAQKQKIRVSRVESTKLLAAALVALSPRPSVWVSASAIGFYGDRGDEMLDEASPPGEGFLPDVCHQWEEATRPAADAGIRVVNVRFGVVLSPQGGALKTMLPPFRFGLGGRLGSGGQYMSWIALDDAVRAIQQALTVDSLHGPANLVAPQPATNAEFTKTLGRVLGRPTIFPMPAPIARLAFGEMADALLLSSARVRPTRLAQSGFTFAWPQLEGALQHMLGKA